MALSKTILTAYGFNANYWKIDKIDIIKKNKIQVLLCGYSSQANSSNVTALEYLTFEFDMPSIEEMDLEDNNIFSLSYEKIKTLEEWLDSEDC